MNATRIAVAAFAATIADFAYGFVVYGNLLTGSFLAQTGVYRTAVAQMAYMPFGAAGIFVAMIAAVLLFARGNYRPGAAGGVVFGFLLALFAIGAAVVVNYATLNISGDHAAKMIAAALGEWLLVGTVIGAVYGPGAPKGTGPRA
jgi:hypothetical protein